MPNKNTLLKYQVITSGDMTGDLTSAVTNIQYLDNIGYQFNFTGTPTGTFSIEVSADYAQSSTGTVTNAGSWVPVSLPASPVAAGSAGSVYIDLNQLSACWIRSKYSATSGTGALDAFITGKSVS